MGKHGLPRYVQKRRRLYYAVLEIPMDLRRHYPGKAPGKRLARLVRSLETDSVRQAARRVAPVVAAWQAEFERLRGGPQDDAAYWRRSLAKARTPEERNLILEQIGDEADEVGALDVPQIGMAPSSSPAARDFYARATGQLVPTADHVDDWIGQFEGAEKTKDMHRADVKRLTAAFPYVQDIQPAEVQKWASGLGLAPKTMGRMLSGLRGYWKYLQRSDIAVAPKGVKPFDDLELPRRKNGKKRQPFKPAEVVQLWRRAAGDDQQLADLIWLGMWTGARIEEICALKVADVFDDHFRVADSKTAAGVREVPIHPKLKGRLARLAKQSSDGYVLAGLTLNKYGDRSNAIGKRFGRLKTDAGHGPELVFHSVRKTVTTLLENAGVPENITADIVGHEKPRITYGLYSGGASLDVKAGALARIKYPT